MKKIFIFFLLCIAFTQSIFLYNYNSRLKSKYREINRLILEQQKKIDLLAFELKLQKSIISKENLPIEKKETLCINHADSAAQIRECVYIAQNEWDKEISKYLNKLKEATTKEQYKLIEDSQALWLKQSNKDRTIIEELVLSHGGTMYSDLAASDNTEISKNRAEFLKWIFMVHTDTISEKSDTI